MIESNPLHAAKRELTGELLARAEQGDERALATVRAIFDEAPACWDAAGNLATMAQVDLVKAVGDGALTQEAIHRKFAALKAELASPTPCPLEQLLIERVALCWLQVHDADARDARLSLTSPGVTITSDVRTERTNATCRHCAPWTILDGCRYRRCSSTSAPSRSMRYRCLRSRSAPLRTAHDGEETDCAHPVRRVGHLFWPRNVPVYGPVR